MFFLLTSNLHTCVVYIWEPSSPWRQSVLFEIKVYVLTLQVWLILPCKCGETFASLFSGLIELLLGAVSLHFTSAWGWWVFLVVLFSFLCKFYLADHRQTKTEGGGTHKLPNHYCFSSLTSMCYFLCFVCVNTATAVHESKSYIIFETLMMWDLMIESKLKKIH